ncbi:MAG TPA: CapA family protein [Spirochaetota bacterium]|nr:CapA family protein [Spirochaetota bacterium]HPV43833.1 CapA family protein [Spirochaetota bacterium]
MLPGSGSGDNTSRDDPGTADPGNGDPGTGGTGDTDAIRLVFAGDTMIDRKVKKSVANNGGGDYRVLFQYTADYLGGADIAFTNLESMISGRGGPCGSITRSPSRRTLLPSRATPMPA